MATKEVYEFLKIRNRPYNANDIVSNLNKHSKSSIQKALDELAEKGRIMEKVNAKQKIYCYVPEVKQDTKELMKMDRELQAHANELEEKLQNIQKEIKKQEAVLTALRNSASIDELQQQKENLNMSIKKLNKKLDELMTTTSKEQNLSSNKRKLEKDVETYQKEYTRRKRKCMDVLECILENYPKSKQNLYEEVGIDIVNV